ncbi:helix-turn-helix transcriptional regulator [Nocardia sp. CA-135398]|uniref:helix-turn-helix transcriptional regulator n=1 Tax=Nocardia sp. CA-135398 TaxID=3239977 RepID=UPI003D997EC6
MRADRLVSLVLLLRQRGRMTADELASELEVSARTVLRDIEALSTAGVPVYADRGRHGGFSLLPGFRTELTGLNHDEALALLTAGSGRGEKIFGLSTALASAMRKVVDALPEGHRASLDAAAKRFLVEPEADLLSRRLVTEEVASGVISEVRHAVLTGHRLRFDYAAPDKAPRSHIVDPIGLVTVRDRTYLLAAKSGEDRTRGDPWHRDERTAPARPATAHRTGRTLPRSSSPTNRHATTTRPPIQRINLHSKAFRSPTLADASFRPTTRNDRLLHVLLHAAAGEDHGRGGCDGRGSARAETRAFTKPVL